MVPRQLATSSVTAGQWISLGVSASPSDGDWLLSYRATMATNANARRKFGGGLIALAGIIAETILSRLAAPVIMIFQSSAVAEILLGRDAGWQVQRREDGEMSHRDTLSAYSLPTFVGITMAVAAYAVSLPLLLWMTPVITGLLLSIPMGILSATKPTGRLRTFHNSGADLAPDRSNKSQ